jgi:diguanylate cyclase (GGDEF)-like protein
MNTIAVRLLAITTGLAVAGLMGLTLLFVATSTLQTGTQDRLTHALAFQDAVGRLKVTLSDEQSGVHTYLLSMDESAIDPYRTGRMLSLDLLSKIDRLVADMPQASVLMPAVRQGIDAWERSYADPAIGAVKQGGVAQYRSQASLAEGATLFGTARVAINHLGTAAAQEQAAAAAEGDGLAADRIWILLGTMAALFALSILAAVLLQRWVGRPIAVLADVAEQVQAGRDVAFPEHRRDEVGRLAMALEGMRLAMVSARTVAEATRADEARRSAERKTLNDFTELLNYLDDEGSVVEATATAIMTSLHPDGLVVHLANASQDRASVALTRGEVAVGPLTLHMLDRCPGVRRGSPFLHANVSGDLAVPCPAHGATEGTVACLPLASGREPLGSVHAIWSTVTRPSETAWRLADRICGQAALTIANRRLVMKLEVSANTDGRTRLPNSRAFDLQAERALAARSDEHVAVVMLDLDHFKSLNDRYGHPAGDEALRVFAEILRSSLRSGDLPARYGGEEFAVLLPGADLDTAMAVAERIRTNLSAKPITLAPGIVADLTVSAGVAVAPLHGTDRVQLLAAADRALYAAKEAGRNMVVGGTAPNAA